MQRYAPLLSAPALWLLRDSRNKARANFASPSRTRPARRWRPRWRLVSQSTHTEQRVDIPPEGRYSFKNLPFGFYRLLVSRSGFTPSSELIEIRSEVPQSRVVTLGIQPVETEVKVHGVRDADRSRSHRRRLLRRRAADEGAAGGTGRPRPDRPRRAAAGLAARSERRAASARIGVCDAVHRERLSRAGQSLAGIRAEHGSRRRPVDQGVHERHSRRVRQESRRRGRGQYRPQLVAGISRTGHRQGGSFGTAGGSSRGPVCGGPHHRRA